MATEGVLAPELYKFVAAVIDDKLKDLRPDRETFDAFRRETTNRMDRVEAAIERLADAQARGEERLTRVEAAVERLTEAQARSEERLTRVEAAVERLTEAQARSEERLTRVEAAIERLGEAQARTDASVKELAFQMTQLSRQVGALSDVIGFGLEDIGRTILPAYLSKRFGLNVPRLERRQFRVGSETIEVDLYGDGTRGDGPIALIGEAKSRIYRREVSQFRAVLSRLRPLLSVEAVPLMFGYFIDLSAQEEARDEILLVASYQPGQVS
ncbi:MAG: hypothetical protein AB1714_03370 [Acidobacteriota bacterium]